MLKLFMMAMREKSLRGDYRLALMAAGDSQGRTGPKTVAYWCNCDESEAEEICDDLVRMGFFEWDGESYVQPQMEAAALQDVTAHGQKGQKKWSASRIKRARIYARDGHKCHYCGDQKNLTLDHKIPQSKGGGHEDENLVTCCKRCNSSKGAKTYDEFLEWGASQ